VSAAPERFLTVGQRVAARLVPPPARSGVHLAGIKVSPAWVRPAEEQTIALGLRRAVAAAIDQVLLAVNAELAGHEGLSDEDWQTIRLEATSCWATMHNGKGQFAVVVMENLLYHCAYMDAIVARMKQDNGYDDGLAAMRSTVEALQRRVKELEEEQWEGEHGGDQDAE